MIRCNNIYRLLKILLFITGVFLVPVKAQSLSYKISSVFGVYAENYLKPFAAGFGSLMNSSLIHSASPITDGFNIYAGVKFSGVFIPPVDASFSGEFHETAYYNISGVAYSVKAKITVNNAPTIFGEKKPGSAIVEIGDTITIAGISYPVTEKWTESTIGGLLTTSFVPFFIPQITIGSYAGTDLMLRFLPALSIGDYGAIAFRGFGIRHNLNQYFYGLPVQLSAMFAYQNFSLSDSTGRDFLFTEGLAFNLIAGTDTGFLKLYSLLQYESSTMELNYIYYPSGSGSNNMEPYKVNFSTTGNNRLRFVAGAAYEFFGLVFNVDFNIGSYSVIGAGIGYGFLSKTSSVTGRDLFY